MVLSEWAFRDGRGGVFAVWDASVADRDFWLQRVIPNGETAPGWPGGGRAVIRIPTNQFFNELIPDGSGGVYVAWLDSRRNGPNLYLQRLTEQGAIYPGWPDLGVLVSGVPGYQDLTGVASDGSGGIYLAWGDTRDGEQSDIFAQHIVGDGSLAPGWPADGLPVCVSSGNQEFPELVADGTGGIFVSWADTQPGAYLHHILWDGSLASGYPENGKLIYSTPSPPYYGGYMTTDLHDGFHYLFYRGSLQPGYFSFYAIRLHEDGTPFEGWGQGGLPTPLFVEQFIANPKYEPDGEGGILFSWDDYRVIEESGNAYLQRLAPDGSRPAGFPADGLLISGGEAYQVGTRATRDGHGGAYVVFTNNLSGSLTWGQHILASGAVAPGWPEGGRAVAPSSYIQEDAKVVSDDVGGAYVVWQERERGLVVATRIGTDGPVDVATSLVSVESSPESVQLRWAMSSNAGQVFTAERRSAIGEWQDIGTLTPDGTGRLQLTDRDIIPGTRYAYRLRWNEGTTTHRTAETWVDVPAAFRFALAGARPNPAAARELRVQFALARRAPGTLELFDLSGRRIASHDVGSLEPGDHLVRLSTEHATSSGIYWLRLTQGDQHAEARVALVQ